MPEIWRAVQYFTGAYQVSNFGNLRSLDRTILNKGSGRTYQIKGKILKPRIDAYGYLITDLWLNGRKTTVKIHRLVAAAFISGSGSEVDHINGQRDDNHITNLRWVNSSQNKLNRHKCRGASGVIGVRRRHSPSNPWQAYGRVKGKWKSLGCFPTKSLAITARQKFIEEVFNG